MPQAFTHWHSTHFLPKSPYPKKASFLPNSKLLIPTRCSNTKEKISCKFGPIFRYFEFLVIFDHSTAGWNRLKGWPEPFWRFWRENSKTTAILLIGSNLLCSVYCLINWNLDVIWKKESLKVPCAQNPSHLEAGIYWWSSRSNPIFQKPKFTSLKLFMFLARHLFHLVG